MFGIRVELVSGRYVATQYNDRNQGEWPPHPARLFSALVAAWGEHEPDSGEGLEERAALEWLEAQEAPRIRADGLAEIARRAVTPVFVPVNDTAVVQPPEKQREELDEARGELVAVTNPGERTSAEKKVSKAAEALAKRTAAAAAAPKTFGAGPVVEARQLLPEFRKKQARTFPSITPSVPAVEFWWSAAPPADLGRPFERLLARVARIGHSSSLVAARVSEAIPEAKERLPFEPASDGALVLRWVSLGQTEQLRAFHEQHHQVETRVMPCTFVTYSDGGDQSVGVDAPVSVFDSDWIVLQRRSGPTLPIISAVGVTSMFRKALQSRSAQPVPEIISGHRPDGSATDQPHIAFVALPNVGGPHADGALLGIAIVLPRAASASSRAQVAQALTRLETTAAEDEDGPRVELTLGKTGVLALQRVMWGRSPLTNLRPGVWCRAAREWITATPIALDKNPGDLHAADAAARRRAFDAAEEIVATAVSRIGLPPPRAVEVSRSVLLPGASKPSAHPRYPIDSSRPQRVLVHARIMFSESVRGPVILGAGRYLGLGLCRPIAEATPRKQGEAS